MRTKALARQYINQDRDSKERVYVLRLQAMAWRHVAIIATVEPERAAKLCQWLFFQTVPFTNGEALEQFIKETEPQAEEAGLKSGVFGHSTLSSTDGATR